MPNRLLSSKAQSALLGALQPNWETIPWEETTGWSGTGMFYPRTGSMSIKPKTDFASPVSMLQKIIKERPGLIFDERTVTQSPLLTDALAKLSKDNYQVTQNFLKNHPKSKLPNIEIAALDSAHKRRYLPMSNLASSDFHPSNIAQTYGKSSVYGNHPVLTRLATKTPQLLEKKLRWIVPSAMLARKFLADKIPGSADDTVFNAITKYGPETYLAASLAGNALPALAGYRAMKMLPKGRVNRMTMKNQLMLNAAKVLGGYGLMAAGRKVFGNKDADKKEEIKKEAGIITPELKEYIAKKTYQLGPTVLAGGAIGYILNRLRNAANESSDEALTAAPLIGAIKHGQI